MGFPQRTTRARCHGGFVHLLITLALPAYAFAQGAAAPVEAAPVEATSAPEIHLLWKDKAPGARGDAKQDRPRLHVYHARSGSDRKAAVVVCPGGGYGTLAMQHEGRDIARWLNSLGITAAVLEYRHRRHGYGHPHPLLDAQRALRTVRHRAEDWSLDASKIGILGFSAGGHLASSASVHHDGGKADAQDPIDRNGCRPDFAVLCYAVIAFDKDFTHKGSQRNLLGKSPSPALVAKMSSERQVKEDTPPTFLWHTSADSGVPPENSIVYYMALRRHRVPCELHIFEKGRHGIGLGKGRAAEAWPELCRRWLVARGVLQTASK